MRRAATQRLGTRLAFDDVGTGYSSLSDLHRLPVDELKVDRSLVSGLASDSRGLAIPRGLTPLAHYWRLAGVAEGIETAEELAHPRGVGGDLGEGYRFAPPAAAAIGDFLTDVRPR